MSKKTLLFKLLSSCANMCFSSISYCGKRTAEDAEENRGRSRGGQIPGRKAEESRKSAEENMRKLGGRIECGRSCLYVLFLLLLFLFLCLALPRFLLVALDATLVVICDVAAVFFRFSG